MDSNTFSHPTCLIVEDQCLFADLLKSAMQTLGNYSSIKIATSGKQAIDQLAEEAFDLVVTDYWLPDDPGHQLVHTVHRLYPATQIVVLTASSDSDAIRQEFGTHARYVLDKMMPLEELICILVSTTGGTAVDEVNPCPELTKLSPREKEVFSILGRGLTNKDMATQLGISLQTIETHRKAIIRKLGVHGAELVRYAVMNAMRDGTSAQH